MGLWYTSEFKISDRCLYMALILDSYNKIDFQKYILETKEMLTRDQALSIKHYADFQRSLTIITAKLLLL